MAKHATRYSVIRTGGDMVELSAQCGDDEPVIVKMTAYGAVSLAYDLLERARSVMR